MLVPVLDKVAVNNITKQKPNNQRYIIDEIFFTETKHLLSELDNISENEMERILFDQYLTEIEASISLNGILTLYQLRFFNILVKLKTVITERSIFDVFKRKSEIKKMLLEMIHNFPGLNEFLFNNLNLVMLLTNRFDHHPYARHRFPFIKRGASPYDKEIKPYLSLHKQEYFIRHLKQKHILPEYVLQFAPYMKDHADLLLDCDTLGCKTVLFFLNENAYYLFSD